MAYVMSIVGLIVVVTGAAWTVLILGTGPGAVPRLEGLGLVMFLLPGFTTIGSGLVFMAIGAGLFRLAQIHDEAKAISDQIDKLIANNGDDS